MIMDKEIASIMFMPVCTKCWKIIWQEIDAQERMGSMHNISPYECPNCGALFDNITIPTKLPFDPYDYKYSQQKQDS